MKQARLLLKSKADNWTGVNIGFAVQLERCWGPLLGCGSVGFVCVFSCGPSFAVEVHPLGMLHRPSPHLVAPWGCVRDHHHLCDSAWSCPDRILFPSTSFASLSFSMNHLSGFLLQSTDITSCSSLHFLGSHANSRRPLHTTNSIPSHADDVPTKILDRLNISGAWDSTSARIKRPA
jgi:hypothetical protein